MAEVVGIASSLPGDISGHLRTVWHSGEAARLDEFYGTSVGCSGLGPMKGRWLEELLVAEASLVASARAWGLRRPGQERVRASADSGWLPDVL
jgi:hypothetical protein